MGRRPARCQEPVGLFRLPQGVVFGEGYVGPDPVLHLGDALKAGPGKFNCAERPGVQSGPGLLKGELPEFRQGVLFLPSHQPE